MPAVHLAPKLRVILGASTANCKHFFSVLKTIMRDQREPMKHARKAHLVQLAFESDLTKKLKTDWEENAFRQFSTSNLKLQLLVELSSFSLF